MLRNNKIHYNLYVVFFLKLGSFIRKEGRQNNFKNYRPIATVSALPKLLDSIVTYRRIFGEIDCEELRDKFVNRDLSYEFRKFRPFLESNLNFRPEIAYFSLLPRLMGTWNNLPTSVTCETYLLSQIEMIGQV